MEKHSFQVPAKERQTAIGSFAGVPFSIKKFFSNPEEIWEPKSVPKEGDWLANHQEEGQTFYAFVTTSAMDLTSAKNVICILPLEKDIPKDLLNNCQKMCKAYFSKNVRVRVLCVAPVAHFQAKCRQQD